MYMSTKLFSALTVAAVLAIPTFSSATTVIFVDQENFENSVLTTESGFSLDTGWRLTMSGPSTKAVDDEIEGVVRSNGESTLISFGSSMSGFGGYFDLSRGGWGHGLRFTLLRSGGAEEVVNHVLSHRNGFFGVSSSEAFDAVRISWSGSKYGSKETYTLADVQLAPAAAGAPVLASGAPEPGAWALMLSGFLFAGGALRRRQTALSQPIG